MDTWLEAVECFAANLDYILNVLHVIDSEDADSVNTGKAVVSDTCERNDLYYMQHILEHY